jgi:hypothetical protein
MKYGYKNWTWELFCLSLFRRRTVFVWHLHGFVEKLQTNVLTLCKVTNYETCLSDVKVTAHCLLFFVFCLSYYTTFFSPEIPFCYGNKRKTGGKSKDKQLRQSINVLTQLYFQININISTTCFGSYGHRQVGYRIRGQTMSYNMIQCEQ